MDRADIVKQIGMKCLECDTPIKGCTDCFLDGCLQNLIHEEATKWHILLNNPNDIPNKQDLTQCLVALKCDNNDIIYGVWNTLLVCNEIKENGSKDLIAWAYIPQLKI